MTEKGVSKFVPAVSLTKRRLHAMQLKARDQISSFGRGANLFSDLLTSVAFALQLWCFSLKTKV